MVSASVYRNYTTVLLQEPLTSPPLLSVQQTEFDAREGETTDLEFDSLFTVTVQAPGKPCFPVSNYIAPQLFRHT